MRIMTILGSPRRQGNTAKVLGWIEEQVQADGHEVDRANILDYRVLGCGECMACKKGAIELCSIRDDANALFRRMVAADLRSYLLVDDSELGRAGLVIRVELDPDVARVGESRQLVQHLLNRLDVLTADEQRLRLRGLDSVHQGRAGDVGVDQRADNTDPVEAAGNEEVVGAVVHQQCHHIAALQAAIAA